MSNETQQIGMILLAIIVLSFCIKDCVLKRESLQKIPNAPAIGKVLEEK